MQERKIEEVEDREDWKKVESQQEMMENEKKENIYEYMKVEDIWDLSEEERDKHFKLLSRASKHFQWRFNKNPY